MRSCDTHRSFASPCTLCVQIMCVATLSLLKITHLASGRVGVGKRGSVVFWNSLTIDLLVASSGKLGHVRCCQLQLVVSHVSVGGKRTAATNVWFAHILSLFDYDSQHSFTLFKTLQAPPSRDQLAALARTHAQAVIRDYSSQPRVCE